MKNKFLQFFTKSQILSVKEFELIKEKCDFYINKNENKKIIIKIEFNALIEPKIFFKIFYRKKDSINNEIEILFNLDNIIYNAKDVYKYMLYYINFYESNIFFKNILKRKECKIEDEKLQIFYLNLNERECLLREKSLIIDFLSLAGICFSDIVFIMDEKHKDIELYKSKKFEIKNYINQKDFTKEVTLRKTTNIKGQIDTISSLVLEQTKTIILGEVFKFNSIQLKNNKTIYKFFITDYSDSIIVKAFTNDRIGLTDELLQTIKVGTWIKVRLDLQVDKYENNDLIGLIKGLSIEKKPISLAKSDTSKVKRVEFINHTKMSAFEGISDCKELMDKLIELGHTHIAITDKFNCQIFPSIYNYKKYNKKNIDLIYGFQTHLSNEFIEIVTNPIDADLRTCEYIVFDIETTGLYPLVDDIIEFGAIKYKNGNILDRKQFFIKGNKPISDFISKLTGIDEEMVSTGLDLRTALIEIKKFFGNSILIAHNGKNFDMKFLNKKLEEEGLELINNTLIDTVLSSRAINKKFKGHSLFYLAKRAKFTYDQDKAHRADFDAEVLSIVWKDMIDHFDSINLKNVKDLNEKLNCVELFTKNRDYIINIHAKNQEGIKNIYSLVSKSSTTKYSKSILFKKDLIEFKDNIIISNSPSEGNIINEAFYGTDDELKKAIEFYDVIFISPISCLDHEINRGNLTETDIQKAIKRILEECNVQLKKVIASSDSYYINEEDIKFFEVYIHAKGLGGKRHRIFNYKSDNSVLPKLHFRTTDELLSDFNFLGKEKSYEIVVQNSLDLAKKINYNIIPIKENLSAPVIHGAKEKLEHLLKQNILFKYGDNVDKSILERISRELKSIIDNGYSVIYWFSHLLVKKSLDDGYMVGSRGSVGSSLVATMVNITDVNPLAPHYLCEKCKYFKYVDSNINSGFDLSDINCPKCDNLMHGDGHNIPFETFMGFDGDKVPDIDLNFSAEYQSKAHEFIRDTFGKSKVLRAGTIGTVAAKTAFGYVKSFFEYIGKTNVRDAEVTRMAIKCEGVKRTTGQHPGGIIVIPDYEDVFSFTPYNFPADDNSQDWYTTHFAFEFLHDSLLKFDILGHDSPTVIKMLENMTKIDPWTIPNYDAKVMDIFKSSKALGINNPEYEKIPGTNGLPEFGTNFVKEMLIVTKPKNFSDLVRISGLSHGTNVWSNNAKDLIEKNNLDISEVISSRDDIMVFLMKQKIDSLLSFQIMENIRKGNGLTDNQIDILKKEGIPEWYIDSCNKIKYLFPKAHATAYVAIAWKIAWFKLYYPLCFYASYFSIRSTVFDLKNIIMGKQRIKDVLNDIKSRLANPVTKFLVKNKDIDLISIYDMTLEMIERGFLIKNIDLNISLEDKYIIVGNGLIPPFSAMDGLGETVSKSIIEARNERKFSSKDDLFKRTKITKTHFQMMESLGILNNLADDEQISLFE